MHAAQFSRYGDPGVLQVVDVPAPVPGPTDVLVEVVCAGVTFAEVMFRRGQFPVGLPHVPGLEVSGVVREVGEAVTTVRAGQRVVALTLAGGGDAELVVAPAAMVVPLEGELARISDAVAAAVPCSVTTAWGLLEAAGVREDETVLVLAAAGGVGSAAVQLAVAQGATVIAAVGHDTKRHAAASWGAKHVVTYDELAGGLDDLLGGRRVDVVLDSVGGAVRSAAAATLGFGGRHVIYGDASDADVQVGTDSVWFTGTSLVGYNLGGLAHADPERLHAHLTAALRSVADGTVGLDVTEHPLADVAAVHQALESRASTGRRVLRVREGRRPGPRPSSGSDATDRTEW